MKINETFARFRASPGTPGDWNDLPSISRFLGGKGRTNQWAHGGTFYMILSPPDFIFNGLTGASPAEGTALQAGQNQLTSSDFELLMMTTVDTFTPHTRTPGVVEHTGLGGMKDNHFNGRNDVTTEFTTTFTELQNHPILESIRMWTSYNNPHYGITSVEGDQHIGANYKGDCYIIHTKPTVTGTEMEISTKDIEQVYYYDGVFPKTVPLDVYNLDITASDLIKPSITWSFDGYPMDKSAACVLERAVEEFNTRFTWMQHYQRHYDCTLGPHMRGNQPGFSMYGSKSSMSTKGRGTWRS